jgi:hypothetical protein
MRQAVLVAMLRVQWPHRRNASRLGPAATRRTRNDRDSGGDRRVCVARATRRFAKVTMTSETHCYCKEIYDGNEKRAVTDLIADLAIPRVPTPEFALVKPDLDASGPESVANLSCRAHIL